MKKAVIIYDDTRIPDRMIRDITGNKSFGDTIYKRMSLRERAGSCAKMQAACCGFFDLGDKIGDDFAQCAFLKLYADMVIRDEKAFSILMEKSLYAKECYQIVCGDKVAGVIYPDRQAYELADPAEEAGYAAIPSDAFLDLGSADAFRRFITGGFDSRFFNELSGDDYTVIKHSANVEKLRREYTFYGLLPDEMKMWFAMPFSYKEENGEASYAMERYHMTDLAIRYVHGAIGMGEFGKIMDKLFRFLTTRPEKTVTAEEYERCASDLYIDKVRKRIDNLKKQEAFGKLNELLCAGTKYDGIDGVFADYLELYQKITAKKHFQPVLVIGHGDLCFSNILYSHETSFMKLIDPKGAAVKEELYTNPYYDLAKLSHSICGGYDYFNSDLFEITVEEDMHLGVRLDCDNAPYKAVFEEYLKRYELDARLIRLYEASLFLSMLPLHMDREKKVLGFVLNAISIMEGIRNE